MIHQIFQACVWILNVAGQWLGLGYEAINVWVFVVIWPLVTVGLVALCAAQAAQLRRLRHAAPEQRP
jgi:hypothetical protein